MTGARLCPKDQPQQGRVQRRAEPLQRASPCAAAATGTSPTVALRTLERAGVCSDQHSGLIQDSPDERLVPPHPGPPAGRGNTASRAATSRGALDWRKCGGRFSLSPREGQGEGARLFLTAIWNQRSLAPERWNGTEPRWPPRFPPKA